VSARQLTKRPACRSGAHCKLTMRMAIEIYEAATRASGK
jgi:hypothetical protein